MFRMAVGHSDDIDLDAALDVIFEACDAGLEGNNPIAGLLFSAWDIAHGELLDRVLAKYPGIELAGATTAGEMSSTLGFREDSIALALFASDTVSIASGIGGGVSVDPLTATRAAVDMARSRSEGAARLCIALATVGTADVTPVLAGLRAALGPGIPILGGGASPDELFRPGALDLSRLFVADGVVGDAVGVLLFSGPLAFSYAVQTGWRPVGRPGIVTSSSLGVIAEIDGRPALEYVERYVGSGGAGPAIANPFAVYEPGSPRFYLRAPVGYDRDAGAVSVFGSVPEGSTVQLTVAGIDDVFGGTKAAIAEALDAFPSESPPGAALLFSCAVRKFVLGTRASHEIELARDILGSGVPLAGFYCRGEIAPMSEADLSRFHNETMVAVLLGAS